MTATVHRCIKHLLLGLAFAAQAAHAGSFGVSPIRLDFDRSAKTGVITVSNDDEIRLSFQLKLFEWTQDAEGKDQYVENGDLIFFPQIMTLEPKEKRLVRVGTKLPAPQTERTYRLFIEEIPEVGEAPAQGTQIAVKLRFGVPIFVAPIKAEMSGAIEDAKLFKGEVQLRVRNTGNQHFRFEAISVKTGSASIGEVQGWYLLPGAARAYAIKVDKDACAKSGKLEISLNGDGLVMKRELDATPASCRP